LLRTVSGLHPIGSRGLRALRGRLALASIPKGLPIEHVKRVLASCNRKSAIGRRDYAILLLLARLGLRAGEVAALTLEDFDWETGRLTLRGKGDRYAELPVPADVGKAIAAYLKDGRTRSTNRCVLGFYACPDSNRPLSPSLTYRVGLTPSY